MSATLPHGLITIGQTDASRNEGSHDADVLFERSNILHAFWKVHAVRHRVTKNSSDYRCQNLFWRTWRDPRLFRTITTVTLTSLWSSCQENISIDSLRGSKELSSQAIKKVHQKARGNSAHITNDSQDSDDSSPTTSYSLIQSASEQESSLVGRLEERRTSVDVGNELDISADTNRKLSRNSRPAIIRTSSSSNRMLAGSSTARTKGRPSMNRRKSSQSTVQGKPAKPPKPLARSPTLLVKDTDKADVTAPTTSTSIFKLPSTSSWEDEPAMDSKQNPTSTSYNDTTPELVEPNFRNRFAERIASSSNLLGTSRIKKTGSVVRFADEVTTDLRRIEDQDRECASVNERRPSLTYRGSTASISSEAIIDEDEASSPNLPRTRSQLSIMLDESRSRTQRQPSQPTPPVDYASLSSRRKRDPTDEEKVLAMAHKEGVTKAGGRQIRKGFKFSDEDESRYSSPSPPPLF